MESDTEKFEKRKKQQKVKKDIEQTCLDFKQQIEVSFPGFEKILKDHGSLEGELAFLSFYQEFLIKTVKIVKPIAEKKTNYIPLLTVLTLCQNFEKIRAKETDFRSQLSSLVYM